MNTARRRRLYRTNWSPKWPTLSRLTIITTFYLAALIFLSIGPLFRAYRFRCVTNTSEACPDFVVPELQKYARRLVYLIDEKHLADRIKSNIPQSEAVTVSAKWPNELSAEITWQTGFVNLGIPASDSAFLVAKNGQIIKVLAEPDQNIPTIIASSAADLIISDTLNDPSLVAAFTILKTFKETNLITNHIDVVTLQDIRVTLTDNKIAVFSGLSSVEDQVQRLQLIRSQTTMSSELPIIDLRYDRPTLKRSL